MLSRDETRQVLAEIDAALKPIAPPMLAAALEETLTLWRTPTGGAGVAGFYLEALEEFSPIIVAAALKHVRMTHHYPNAPLPADFRRAALEAAAPLRGARSRAKIAAKRFEMELERENRWTTRQPVVIAEGTYDKRAHIRERTDGTPEVDLGNIDEHVRSWEKGAA